MVLSRTGRAVRVAALLAGLALLLAGSAWGDDDHFPFGPFRMYSTADDPDGRVQSTYVRAVDADGRVVDRVAERHVGLRRAEYEGQLSRIVGRPEILGDLADAFSRRHPDAVPWAEVSVVRTSYQLLDGEPTGETTELLARWTAP